MHTTAIFGCPGTGKTTHLAKLISQLAPACPNMAVVSFSRAAAGVLTSRLRNHSIRYIGTLHALAFKVLGLTRQSIATEDRFATWYGADIDEVKTILSVYNYSYHHKVDMAVAFTAINPIIPFLRVEHLIQSYLNWKETYQYLDFNDMVAQAIGRVEPFDVVIVDEAQDCTNEQWQLVLSMTKPTTKLYVAGDDDQCQPEGTVVKTQCGDVRIEELDPTIHRVWSYNANDGGGVWSTFTMSCNWTQTPFLHEVEVNGNKSLYTPNHKCLARFDVSQDSIDTLRVVYLMSRGGWFRVGETKAFIKNKNGVTFYPNNRMRQERADSLWVLKVCDSEVESKQWEALYSLQFGIPTQIFDYSGLRLKNVGNKGLHKFIHDNLPVHTNADRLLKSLDMDIRYPTIVKKSGGQKTFEVRAMNLHPRLMKMATYVKNGPPQWHHFTMNRVRYYGVVYSLDVKSKSKTYFADNVWTHNSLFTWAGANPHGMIELADEQVVLGQSYRIPKSVHALAEATVGQISRRVPKEYKPISDIGTIECVQHYEPMWYRYKHTVLCRDKWALDDIEQVIIERGIPYTKNGERGMFERGRCQCAKAIILEDHQTVKRLSKYLRRDYREDIIGACRVGWQKALDFGTWYKESSYLALVDPCADPLIHLSTVHGFKGEEDDRVVLVANCTSQVEAAIDNQESYDNEVRVWYVGLTRCKQLLTIVGYNQFINFKRGE